MFKYYLIDLFLYLREAIFKVLIEFKNGLHIKYYSWNIIKEYAQGKQKQKELKTMKNYDHIHTANTCMQWDGNI